MNWDAAHPMVRRIFSPEKMCIGGFEGIDCNLNSHADSE